MEKLNLVKSNFEQLPNNIEAEQAILGSVLVSNEIFDDVSPIINSTKPSIAIAPQSIGIN